MAGKGNDKKQTNVDVQKENIFNRMGSGIMKYFNDLKLEFKRITWPTKKDIKKATIAVVVFSLVYIAYVGVLDYGFGKLFKVFVYKIVS